MLNPIPPLTPINTWDPSRFKRDTIRVHTTEEVHPESSFGAFDNSAKQEPEVLEPKTESLLGELYA